MKFVRKIFYISVCVITIILSACKGGESKPEMVQELQQLKQEQKFVQEAGMLYPGLQDTTLRPVMSEKINLAADDFLQLVARGNATDADYQAAVAKGLERFSSSYPTLDRKDRERVCNYFKEMMDIVDLKTSGGQLDRFVKKAEHNK